MDESTLSFDHVVVTFVDDGKAIVELGFVGSDGAPFAAFTNTPSVDIELDSVPHDKLDSAPVTDFPALCNGTGELGLTERDADPVTKRFKVTVHLSSLRPRTRGLPCVAALLEEDYHGPIYVELRVNTIVYHAKLDGYVLPDHRAPNVPALDAEIARLKGAVGKLSGTFPACTAELVGDRPLEAVAATAFPDASFPVLTTHLFARLDDYSHRNELDPPGTLELLDKQAKLGFYVTSRFQMPSLEHGQLSPGIFDGRLVVLDRATATPLCALPIHAESSDNVQYKRTSDQTGREVSSTAVTAIEHDFRDNLARAVVAAFAAFPAATPDVP